MKRALCVCIVLIVAAAPAGAQHAIGVFSDAAGSDCNLVATFGQVVTAYVVYSGSGMQLASYQVDVNWPNGTHLSSALPYICIVPCDPVDDGTVWALGCQAGSVVLASMTFLVSGPAGNCDGTMRVIPFGTAQLEVEDCSGTTVQAFAGSLTVNEVAVQCPCDVRVPVEETSWGRVKALYE